MSGGRWFPFVENSGRLSRVWCDILGVADCNPNLRNFYFSNVDFVIGNGNRIGFWEDKWLDNQCFKESFARLYGLVTNCDVSLREMLIQRGASVEWCFQFRRPLRE